jgi:glutathione peroxidase
LYRKESPEGFPEGATDMIPMLVHLLTATLGPVLAAMPVASLTSPDKASGGIYDFTMKSIDGKNIPLSSYRGKVVLLVNVASQCGNTPQYKGLEALYRKYREKGFVILGFPANNFGQQEPGSDTEIKAFCTTTYNVTFDLFSKISVKGSDQHPLYRFLTSAETNPEFAGDVKWNFQKYLIGRQGKILGKFAPGLDPLSADITAAIEKALGSH